MNGPELGPCGDHSSGKDGEMAESESRGAELTLLGLGFRPCGTVGSTGDHRGKAGSEAPSFAPISVSIISFIHSLFNKLLLWAKR